MCERSINNSYRASLWYWAGFGDNTYRVPGTWYLMARCLQEARLTSLEVPARQTQNREMQNGRRDSRVKRVTTPVALDYILLPL